VSGSDRPPSMKIAIVIESFDPHAGGLERSTAQIAQELADRGHAVTLLAGGCGDTHCLPGVTIVAMAKRKRSSAFRLFRFNRWAQLQIADGGFDVSLSMTTAVPAAVLQPRGGTVRETLDRNIAMRRTNWARVAKRVGVLLNPKQQLLLYFERRAFKNDGLVKVAAVSRYVIEQLERHYDLPSGKVELIPNAAVMPKIDADKRAQWRKRIRDSFNIPDDVTVFLFAAINPRLKGFEPLMQATALIKERGVPAVVLLAGDFWHRHNQYATQLGVRDRVRFIRHTKRIEALYAAADVTVHPTFYDPASKVVIESLMMGVPAISTAYNGASDLIAPGLGEGTGGDGGAPLRGRVIQDPADALALADAMQDLADAGVRQKCSEAAAGLDGVLSMGAHVDLLEGLLRESSRINSPNPVSETR
jgi:UDP-glucose:(heptosyl)LPS alpha-1,3-glucosyltransferase